MSHLGNDIIPGVSCSVQECKYHERGDKCTAGKIKVAGKDPRSSIDTECSTFEEE